MEKEELIELVKKSQAKDTAAIEELLRAAYTPVKFQCRKMLKNSQDAEDVTQEVLLTLYTRLHTLKEPAAFWGWLNRTTENRCKNVLMRSHVDLQILEDEDGHSMLDNIENIDQQIVPDAVIDNAETTRMFEEMVDALPEAQRMCVLMFYYDEMSVKEIAEIMDTSENTVKSRLNYARKAIKEQVLDYEKAGTKLYGLSPLPFLLFFLRKAAEEGTDDDAARSMVTRVMETGAAGSAAGAAGTAGTAAKASGAAVGAAETAAGTAASHALLGLSGKAIVRILAGLCIVGGAVAVTASVINNSNRPDAAIVMGTETGEEKTETLLPQEDPTEETLSESEEEERAQREAYISSLPYTGDAAECALRGEQAEAFAAVLDGCVLESQGISRYDAWGEELYSDTFCRAALFDAGNGIPALWVMEGGRIFDDYSAGCDPYEPRLLRIYYWDGTQAVLAVEYESSVNPGFSCDLTEQGLLLRRIGSVMENYGNNLGASMYASSEIYGVSDGRISEEPIHVLEKFTVIATEPQRNTYVKKYTEEKGYDIDYDYDTLTEDKWKMDSEDTSPYAFLYCFDGHFCSHDVFEANGLDGAFWDETSGYGFGDSCELGGGNHLSTDIRRYWIGNWADAEETALLLRGNSSGEPDDDSEDGVSEAGAALNSEGLLVSTRSGDHPGVSIRRTMLDAQGQNLEVYFEIPVLEEREGGYGRINSFFTGLNESFWSSDNEDLEMIREMVMKYPPSDTYYYRNDALLYDWTDRYISASISYNWYMGGVADYGSTNYNFSIDTGERLFLDDMIDGSEDEIREMIADAMIQTYADIETAIPEAIDAICSYDIQDFDFYISKGRIHICFDKYEIAYGAAGGFEAILPVSLKAEWK